jgi:hypothetical protein
MDLSGKYYLPMTWNAEGFVMTSAKVKNKPQKENLPCSNSCDRSCAERCGRRNLFQGSGWEKIFANGNRVLRAVLHNQIVKGRTVELDILSARKRGDWKMGTLNGFPTIADTSLRDGSPASSRLCKEWPGVLRTSIVRCGSTPVICFKQQSRVALSSSDHCAVRTWRPSAFL